LANNSLSGNLPSDSEFSCPNLKSLYFAGNKFSGLIPSYISNCSKLVLVEFAANTLSGAIPTSLGQLKYLKELYLGDNLLSGEPDQNQELNFFSSLINCRFLELVYLSNNPLDITLPDSIGNFSVSLRTIVSSQTQIRGHIPISIGSLKNLAWLDLGKNKFDWKYTVHN